MDREQFAIDNIGLLYSYYKKYKISDEDLRQDFALAYWKAIKSYDINSNIPLGSYVYTVLNMEMAVHIRYVNRKKRTLPDGVVAQSFDEVVNDVVEKDIRNIIGDFEKGFSQVECDDVIGRLSEYLPKKQRDIMGLTYKGYKGCEIAQMLNTSKQNVSATLSRAQKVATRLLWKEMME